VRRGIDVLFVRKWWSYRPDDVSWFSIYYHTFNLFEGTVWVVFAILVARRSIRARHSTIEAGYALAFLTFGLTDYWEAYELASWLIWIKLVNLLILIGLRALVIRRFYPTSKLY
jgi:hypothetical protein